MTKSPSAAQAATTLDPSSMSALVATSDPKRRTERRRIDVPRPGVGEIVIAVAAFSINRGELALLAHREAGWRPGQDIAGEVTAIGAGVTQFRVGQRVAALIDGGGWAQYASAPVERVAAIPDGVTAEQAAALPMAGTTALNLVRRGGALLGRRALVTGASGGVGGFAVQLLARAGAHVIAVARPDHAERLQRLGATEVIDELHDDLDPVDFALESVGGSSLAAIIGHVAPSGTIVMFGNSSGEPTPVDVLAFVGGHEEASLQTYFSYRHENQAGSNLATLLRLTEQGKLHVEIGLHDSWDAIEDALNAFTRRTVTAKAVLTIT